MTTEEDHPELAQTHALADGELRGDELAQAQEHLATCTRCQAELADVMQLAAMPMPRPTNVVSLAWYRKRSTQVAGLAVFAAAAIAILYVGKKQPAVAEHHDAPKIALAEKRALEARVSWEGASSYRAYSVPRGQSLAKEAISLAAMADLEKAGDLHGVGALALLGGDLEQAKKYLALAGETPAVMADHAALELSLGHPAVALMLADSALAKAPDDPVATWNRALALRDLGLNHGAAEAFRAVAEHAEAGWSAEATQRADVLEKTFADELKLQNRLWEAIDSFSKKTPIVLSLDDARRMPGASRMYFYEALRTAPTAEAVGKLKPLAEALDSVEHGTGNVNALTLHKPDAVAAQAYRELLAFVMPLYDENDPKKRAAAEPVVEKLLATLRAHQANDALVVAFLKFPKDGLVLDKDLAELTRLAAGSKDPWIQLIGIEQRAQKALAKSDLSGAEAALLGAKPICANGGPSYRCMKVGMLLGKTYVAWQRLPEARAALLDAYSRARALSQQWEQDVLLAQLTNVSVLADNTVGGGLPLVRAYASEVAARGVEFKKLKERDSSCDQVRWAHERIATELMIQLRVSEAAQEIAAGPQCNLLSMDALASELFVQGEILKLAGTPTEIAKFRKDVAAARTRPDLDPGHRALLDHAEGRALVGSDPIEGEKLLRRAITDGADAPANRNAKIAAGESYAMLAVLAAKRGDGPGALAVLAEELKVSARPTCVLGVVLNDRDVVAVARDATGKVITDAYESAYANLVADKIVRGRVVDALRACPDVDVIARAPFHGLARILPDEIAWRYLSTRTRPVGESHGPSLVVSDVQPPAALGLPHLASWTGGDATVIRGAAATPAHVLAAIGTARDVIVNAHGLADGGDAAYLALSADVDGRYTLTSGDVERANLTSNPLVILAACEAAKAAPVSHSRWSLPAAFVTAGARAVVASTSAIPDGDAGAFFSELRSRALAGQPLAVVLRDLRKKWLVAPHTSFWVRDVVVFE